MKRFLRPQRILAVVGISFTVLCLSCGGRPPVTTEYQTETDVWRANRIDELTAEDGWLTLVGLYWLQPGINRFGSAPNNQVILNKVGIPPVAGNLELLEDGSVLLHTAPEIGMKVGGLLVTEKTLAPDKSGKPDIVEFGSLRFFILARADQRAVRVRDVDSAARSNFKGIEYFPIDLRYRVKATFEPYSTPKDVEVPSAQGPAQKMLAMGLVRFKASGKRLTLEAFGQKDSRALFIIFRDVSSGVDTYGAGRFLEADAPASGKGRMFMDFNRAYNPPCAFTPYATCPLPPMRNNLKVRIEAGEKYSGEKH